MKCPVCNGKEIGRNLKVETYLRLREYQSLHSCMDCCHSWRTPLISDDVKLKDRYELDQGLVRYATYTANYKDGLPRHLEQRLKNIQDRQCLLDFGSGDGTFLAFARAKGIEAWGIDCDTSAISNEVLKSFIKSSIGEFSEETFDFVHANHVLEHVDDPVTILRELRSKLKLHGKILIEVPNELYSLATEIKILLGLKSISATSLYEHQHYFTVKSLRHALQAAGFTELTDGTPRRIFRGGRGVVDKIASIIRRGEVIYATAINGKNNA